MTNTLVPVSGTIFVPEKRPAHDELAIVAWAHASTGLGDSCTTAHSLTTPPNQQIIKAVLQAGGVFVATDYQGIGTPGEHPYIVGISEGRNALDSIRAAATIAKISPTPNSAVIGQSQGGGAALFAAELQPKYAPELKLRGVIATAPPGELHTLSSSLDGGRWFGYLLMAVSGFEAAYPGLKADNRFLTAAGRTALGQIRNQCSDQILKEYASQHAKKFGIDRVIQAPDFQARLEENNPGGHRTSVPILIVHGDADDTIPVRVSHTLFHKYCALGVTVVAKFYPGKDHVNVFNAALPYIGPYLTNRLNDKPAPSNCPTASR